MDVALVVTGVLAGVVVGIMVSRRRSRIRNSLFSLGPVTARWLSRNKEDR
jgi:hypothetical protein